LCLELQGIAGFKQIGLPSFLANTFAHGTQSFQLGMS